MQLPRDQVLFHNRGLHVTARRLAPVGHPRRPEGRHETNFRRFAAVLDKRLDGKRYVVGESLTLADLTLASSLMYAKQTEVPLGEFPHIQAWFSRISEMDAWKKTNA